MALFFASMFANSKLNSCIDNAPKAQIPVAFPFGAETVGIKPDPFLYVLSGSVIKPHSP